MFYVSKGEADFLRKHGADVTVLNRQAPSRKKRWLATEDSRTYKLLERYKAGAR